MGANGLRAFSASSLKRKFVSPRSLSLPGRVKISMRPKPGWSYSAEKGLALSRISRMADLGGMRPPVKPSMKICPPLGPAAGPASACSASAISSGSSGSASRSSPLMTMAPALFRGSMLSGGLGDFTVTVSSTGASTSCTSRTAAGPAVRSTASLAYAVKRSFVTRTV